MAYSDDSSNIDYHPKLVELVLACNRAPPKNKSAQSVLTHSILLDAFRLEKRAVVQKSVLVKAPKFEMLYYLNSYCIIISRFGTFWRLVEESSSEEKLIELVDTSPQSTLKLFKEPKPVLMEVDSRSASPNHSNIGKYPCYCNSVQNIAYAAPLQTIRIKLPRFGSIEAMLCALEFLSTGKVYVEKRHFFELLVVAHWLQVDKLVNLCVSRISNSLSLKTIIPACHFSFRCGLDSLLDDCYRWILSNFLETGQFLELIQNYFSSIYFVYFLFYF